MKTLKETERALRDSSLCTTPELDDKILMNAGVALDAALGGSEAGRSTLVVWWKGAVRSRPFKLAAASVMVCGLILLSELGGVLDSGGVAWAQVPDRMAQEDRIMFRLSIHLAQEAISGEAQNPVDADGNTLSLAYFGSSMVRSCHRASSIQWRLIRRSRSTTKRRHGPGCLVWPVPRPSAGCPRYRPRKHGSDASLSVI